ADSPLPRAPFRLTGRLLGDFSRRFCTFVSIGFRLFQTPPGNLTENPQKSRGFRFPIFQHTFFSGVAIENSRENGTFFRAFFQAGLFHLLESFNSLGNSRAKSHTRNLEKWW